MSDANFALPYNSALPHKGRTVLSGLTTTIASSPAARTATAPSVGRNQPDLAAPDLVVLSHLRWTGAWQRPHHLVSRLAAARAASGARTFFVEEPLRSDVAALEVRHERHGDVTRVWLAVPTPLADPPDLGFDSQVSGDYGDLLARDLYDQRRPAAPDVWVYTPMALDLAHALAGGRLVYDVMDDLSSFRNAPAGLLLGQRRLLREADVVFTGGPSLHRSIVEQRRGAVHLFRSGVEGGHFAAARRLRRPHARKVAGFVGVIDERLNLDLVAGLAAALPDWTVRLVGPVTKIDPADLPQAPNLEYPGLAAYGDLPKVMAGFDVALMPFALNAATRSISPTKTLEYLAAGLPVVSTRVPDVVADYAKVVHLADDAGTFAAACREVVTHRAGARDEQARPFQDRQEWNYIASQMARWLDHHTLTDAAGSTMSARGASVGAGAVAGAVEQVDEVTA
ncbi:MAG: glycosyltransferase [bacterium]